MTVISHLLFAYVNLLLRWQMFELGNVWYEIGTLIDPFKDETFKL